MKDEYYYRFVPPLKLALPLGTGTGGLALERESPLFEQIAPCPSGVPYMVVVR